ncbi:MAG: hypothetical protein QXY90_07090 [Candidatus Anstonellales archaeon]
MGKEMKILLIGMKRWGKNHLKILKNMVDELFIADSDPKQLKNCDEISILGNIFL